MTILCRPPQESDLPQLVQLINNSIQQAGGAAHVSEQSVRTDWNGSRFDPQHDVYTAWNEAGIAVGYVEVISRNEPAVKNRLQLHVFPYDSPVAEQLLAWAENHVERSLERVDPELMVFLSIEVEKNDLALGAFLNEHGFQITRHFWEMAIDLHTYTLAISTPAPITLRSYDPASELTAIARVHHESFKDHWGNLPEPFEVRLERWQAVLEDPMYNPELFYVALINKISAGIAICFEDDSDPNLVTVEILATHPDYRRQGVGLALLGHAFADLKQRGKTRAVLGVDASSSTGATRLYEKAGMHVTHQQYHYEKTIRAGRDVRHQGNS